MLTQTYAEIDLMKEKLIEDPFTLVSQWSFTLVSQWPEGRWRTGEAVCEPDEDFTGCRGGGFCSPISVTSEGGWSPSFSSLLIKSRGWIKQAHLYPRDTAPL